MVEKKQLILMTAIPAVAIAGIGAYYYYSKKKGIIVQVVSVNPTEFNICDSQTVAIKITDGAGNPLANEPFQLMPIVDGQQIPPRPDEIFYTGLDGMGYVLVTWYTGPALEHSDTERRLQVQYVAIHLPTQTRSDPAPGGVMKIPPCTDRNTCPKPPEE